MSGFVIGNFHKLKRNGDMSKIKVFATFDRKSDPFDPDKQIILERDGQKITLSNEDLKEIEETLAGKRQRSDQFNDYDYEPMRTFLWNYD